jgi:hypothetical protein
MVKKFPPMQQAVKTAGVALAMLPSINHLYQEYVLKHGTFRVNFTDLENSQLWYMILEHYRLLLLPQHLPQVRTRLVLMTPKIQPSLNLTMLLYSSKQSLEPFRSD